jgi:hypothetical protein
MGIDDYKYETDWVIIDPADFVVCCLRADMDMLIASSDKTSHQKSFARVAKSHRDDGILPV